MQIQVAYFHDDSFCLHKIAHKQSRISAWYSKTGELTSAELKTGNQCRNIHRGSPAWNEAARHGANYKKHSICQQCHGKGYFSAWLTNHGTKQKEFHTAISCVFPGCKGGIVDKAENRRILSGE